MPRARQPALRFSGSECGRGMAHARQITSVAVVGSYPAGGARRRGSGRTAGDARPSRAPRYACHEESAMHGTSPTGSAEQATLTGVNAVVWIEPGRALIVRGGAGQRPTSMELPIPSTPAVTPPALAEVAHAIGAVDRVLVLGRPTSCGPRSSARSWRSGTGPIPSGTPMRRVRWTRRLWWLDSRTSARRDARSMHHGPDHAGRPAGSRRSTACTFPRPTALPRVVPSGT